MKSLYLYQLILFGLIIDPPSPKKKRNKKFPKTCTLAKCTLEGDLEVEVD